MDTFQHLMNGFMVAMSVENILCALMGCVLGTLVGLLPGISAGGTMAILVPFTFKMHPTGAIIMLSAIYYGAQYGGTITSVLVNVPGEPSSAITCIEGYQMTRKGRAGVALTMSVIGSFVGGTFAVLGLVVAAPPLARAGLAFGPPEFFALMVMGTSLVMGLAGKSILKALMMGILGLLLAMVGMDPSEGSPRFTFGQVQLLNGIEFIPVIMGLFGIAEIFVNLEESMVQVFQTTISTLIPTKQDAKDSAWPIVRGTVIGFFLGLIPGTNTVIASFMSYLAEKKLSRHPEKFGTGAIEGVAGPETANNAFATSALIPLFTLGIPGSAVMALLLGTFMMHGVIPGPLLFRDHPELIWTVIASLYVGNVILVVLNLPLIGIWVRILKTPYPILLTLILLFTVIGAYCVNSTSFDVGLMVLFGVLGYLFKKLDFPVAPLVLTLILGPLMEKGLRLSLELSQGDFSVFYTRPISATLLVLAALIIILSAVRFKPFRSSVIRGDAQL